MPQADAPLVCSQDPTKDSPQEACEAKSGGSQGRLGKHPCPEAWAKERPQRCCEHGPCAVVGGREQKVLLPFQVLTSPAGKLLPRATPNGLPAHRRLCPYWLPLSSLIWTQLSPWSLGQRHFWKHRCQWRSQQLQASQDHCPALWKTGQNPKGAL